MRPIDADELEGKYRLMYDAETENGVMAVSDFVIDHSPTLDAIPIEFIESHLMELRKKRDQYEYKTGIYMDWDDRVDTIEELLDAWREEHETD